MPQKANSYGIIPVFKDGDIYKTVLVRNQLGHWGLPKGTPKEGEQPLDTAKRELTEETGIADIQIDTNRTFEEKYSFEVGGVKYEKTVIYYVGLVNTLERSDKLIEVSEAKWATFEEADALLPHPEPREILRQIETYLR